jgi:hypothetical protein
MLPYVNTKKTQNLPIFARIAILFPMPAKKGGFIEFLRDS